jgi:hypothetical protein
MAAQLALSIKYHNPNISICLVVDDSIHKLPEFWKSQFDHIKPLKQEHLYIDGVMQAGYAKLNAYHYTPYDRTIYLDVDGICIQDIQSLFDQCNKFYQTEVIDRGKIDDKIDYSHWATNKNIWEYFEIDQYGELCSTQSSFQYFEKSKEMDELYELFLSYFNYPIEKLKNQWGKAIPDELIISGCCAKLQHDPSIEGRVVFFGHYHDKRTLNEIAKSQYINSLYGNGSGRTLVKPKYKDWYSRMIINMAKSKGHAPLGKANRLMKTKHVG